MHKTKEVYSIIIRYLLILAAAFPNLFIFYFIFTPLTLYASYFVFNLFFDVSIMGNILIVNNYPLELINAFIAGAAYYFLFILNLSIPKIKPKKTIKMLLFSFSLLLLINILRIFLLGVLFFSEFSYFNIAHKLFWYSLSIVFVVGIWFIEVKLFKIKEIPIYSDLKFLYFNSSLRKKY